MGTGPAAAPPKCTSAWVCVIHRRMQWGEKAALGLLANTNPPFPARSWLTRAGMLGWTWIATGQVFNPAQLWLHNRTWLSHHHISNLTSCKVGGYNVKLCLLPGQNIHRSPHLLFVPSHWGSAVTDVTMPQAAADLRCPPNSFFWCQCQTSC